MTLSTSAEISFPLDIPKVDVMGTNLTRAGQFIITVESQQESTAPLVVFANKPFHATADMDRRYSCATCRF